MITAEATGDCDKAETVGIALADELLGKGAREILAEVYCMTDLSDG